MCFGKFGIYYWNIVCGIDNCEVCFDCICKFIGVENIFFEDLCDIVVVWVELEFLVDKVWWYVLCNDMMGCIVMLKVKYGDFW